MRLALLGKEFPGRRGDSGYVRQPTGRRRFQPQAPL